MYGQEEFEKYTERVRLYDDDQAFMRDLFRIQEVLDWPTGQQMRPNWVKYVLLDEQDQILAQDYLRHASKIGEVFRKILGDLQDRFPGENMAVTVSGSAGMGLAEKLGLPFVQEVYAERLAVGKYDITRSYKEVPI